MPKRPFNKRHALMLKWGAPCALGAVVLSWLAILATDRTDPAAPNADGTITGLTSKLSRDITEDMLRFSFTEVAEASGITFQHFPATRDSLLPEDMGSGLAWGDYDNDGDPDLFIVNFKGNIRPPETSPRGSEIGSPTGGDSGGGGCALFQNNGDGSFTDVSQSAGLDLALYGMAAAWGDYDNDGSLDLYVTGYNENALFHNNADGTFTDVTDATGTQDLSFSAGCSWLDYDRDGWIDLYVCNYVKFTDRRADSKRSAKQYGSVIPYTINPSAYPPAPNRLYRNNGDGSFTDVAVAAGVDDPSGRSLGAACFDFDLDGWIDLYIANDVSKNGVFHNQGDGTFIDIGASSLAADYRGAMGLAVGDYEHDGDFDLFVTHWLAQENAFYENMTASQPEGTDDRILFMDAAELNGLGQISLKMVGWASAFTDFDNDGWLDLFVVNGDTLQNEQDNTLLRPQFTQIFIQEPDRGFFDIAPVACTVLQTPLVGRGGAWADYNLDGRIDLAILPHAGKPLLLKNTTENDQHWISIKLRQTGGNTFALGARVSVRTGDLTQLAQVGADPSYLSQNQLNLHFGLGHAATIDELTISWPDGKEETHTQIETNRVVEYHHEAVYD